MTNILGSENHNGKFDSEQEQQNPKDIALAVFRFRARRGIGVFYALLSIAPLVAALLAYLSAPAYVSQISIPVIFIVIWLFARIAGMHRFYEMNDAISLFEGKEKRQKQRNKLTEILKRGFSLSYLAFSCYCHFRLDWSWNYSIYSADRMVCRYNLL